MRLIVLKSAAASLPGIARDAGRDRAASPAPRSSQTNRPPALAEYLWATIPWLMIISSRHTGRTADRSERLSSRAMRHR